MSKFNIGLILITYILSYIHTYIFILRFMALFYIYQGIFFNLNVFILRFKSEHTGVDGVYTLRAFWR